VPLSKVSAQLKNETKRHRSMTRGSQPGKNQCRNKDIDLENIPTLSPDDSSLLSNWQPRPGASFVAVAKFPEVAVVFSPLQRLWKEQFYLLSTTMCRAFSVTLVS
jgi:hypothetical protein